MKYEVIDNFKIRTSGSIKELTKGMVLTIPPEKAKTLIEKSKIKPLIQKFNWEREWEEKGKFIWREKGELTIESQRLGGQVVKLLAGKEKYNLNCSCPQFVLPDDFELIEALDKTLKVFPGSRIVGLNKR